MKIMEYDASSGSVRNSPAVAKILLLYMEARWLILFLVVHGINSLDLDDHQSAKGRQNVATVYLLPLRTKREVRWPNSE